MSQSDSIAKLNEALVKAQTEFTVVPKNKTGREGNREFKYADLADVMGMALPKLNKHGIFLSQPLVLDADGQHLRQTTRLQLGDEFIQSDGIRLKDVEGAGKQLGIEVTYARRIDLNGTLGISPDEDLDAPDLKSDPKGTVHLSKPGFPISVPKAAVTNVPNLPGYTVVTSGSLKSTGLAATSFEYGQNAKIEDTTKITDADLPDFPEPEKLALLSAEAQAVADHLISFVPLSKDRNDQIQNRLKELVTNKTVGRRELSLYLDDQHEGKKQFDVSAAQWEKTIGTIEQAVAEGSIKTLLKTKRA